MIRYRDNTGRFISVERARALGRKARTEFADGAKNQTKYSSRGYYAQQATIQKHADIIRTRPEPKPSRPIPVYDWEDELETLEDEFPELDELDELDDLDLVPEDEWYSKNR